MDYSTGIDSPRVASGDRQVVSVRAVGDFKLDNYTMNHKISVVLNIESVEDGR